MLYTLANGEIVPLDAGMIWNRTLRLREENDNIQHMFENEAIEDSILDSWCKENGIQIINA